MAKMYTLDGGGSTLAAGAYSLMLHSLADLILRVCFNLHKFSLHGKITARKHVSIFFKNNTERETSES